jgi:hypothetical protein
MSARLNAGLFVPVNANSNQRNTKGKQNMSTLTIRVARQMLSDNSEVFNIELGNGTGQPRIVLAAYSEASADAFQEALVKLATEHTLSDVYISWGDSAS